MVPIGVNLFLEKQEEQVDFPKSIFRMSFVGITI